MYLPAIVQTGDTAPPHDVDVATTRERLIMRLQERIGMGREIIDGEPTNLIEEGGVEDVGGASRMVSLRTVRIHGG